MHHLGEIGERIGHLSQRCVERLLVLQGLQLSGQAVDLGECAVIAGVDQALEVTAGLAARGVEIADHVALQRKQHRRNPGEHVPGRRDAHSHGVAEFIDLIDELRRDVDIADQLVATVLTLQCREGLHHPLHTGRDLSDLTAHIGQPGRQGVGALVQPIEIVHVAEIAAEPSASRPPTRPA